MSRSQLFHGARNRIDDTHVRPPSVTGAPAYHSTNFSSGRDQTPHPQLAFATELEHSAWGYARNGAYHAADHEVNHDPDPRHRSRVYEVEPAHDQKGGAGETFSPTGFRITAEHLSAPDVTSTFHELNWNAFKAKPKHLSSSFVSSGDANHSYMEVDPDLKDKPAPVIPLKEAGGYQSRHAVDLRHPDQLNLFTGKTVLEHRVYEDTPGVLQHLHPGQFANVAFHRDPTVGTIRRSKDYHRVDEQFGMVHG